MERLGQVRMLRRVEEHKRRSTYSRRRKCWIQMGREEEFGWNKELRTVIQIKKTGIQTE
jgi:hypothetical protein